MNFPLVLLATLLLASPPTHVRAEGEPLEIKGLRIGMTKDEVRAKFPGWDGFTVAGAPAKYSALPVLVKYHEEKLDQFTFVFTPQSFDIVLSAFKDKYPALDCSTSTLSNAMGATFDQVTCILSVGNSVLALAKYSGDISTSLLSLYSTRFAEEQTEKQRRRKKDI